MVVYISYINLLNLSWIIKCLFMRTMEPSNIRQHKSMEWLSKSLNSKDVWLHFSSGVHVCSSEHSDLPLVKNLWMLYGLGMSRHISWCQQKGLVTLLIYCKFKIFLFVWSRVLNMLTIKKTKFHFTFWHWKLLLNIHHNFVSFDFQLSPDK